MSTLVVRSGFAVRTLPIDQLQPAAYNPRKALKPTDKAYLKLKASLTDFGLVEPLVWNQSTGRLVGGHARLRILKELGYTDVPVSVVELTEAQERALNIVLNNQEAQGRYDTEKLAELLQELHDLPEFEMTGFDNSILAALRFEPAATMPEEPKPQHVEVTIVAEPAQWDAFSGRLDELVREFDLVTHVRRV